MCEDGGLFLVWIRSICGCRHVQLLIAQVIVLTGKTLRYVLSVQDLVYHQAPFLIHKADFVGHVVKRFVLLAKRLCPLEYRVVYHVHSYVVNLVLVVVNLH